MGDGERIEVEEGDVVLYISFDQNAYGLLPATLEPIYPPKCMAVIFSSKPTRVSYDSFVRLAESRGWRITTFKESELFGGL